MAHENKPLYNVGDKLPVATMRFLTESQECDFVEFLAYLGLNLSEDTFHNRGFTEDDILGKLFINLDDTLFLKNKYLYLYGEGASNYLFARQSMVGKKNELDELELKILIKVLTSEFTEIDIVNLIALGSANAVKEIDALKKLKSNRKRQTCKLIPVDVSATLIQLAVLYFHKAFKELENSEEITIEPIIGDIYDAKNKKDELFKLITGKKVFTLLGSTIGNYRETDLLKNIIGLMNEDDILILGFDIISGDERKLEEDKKFIYSQYNTIGNILFQLSPLAYIPKYKGYIERFDRYFKLEINDSVIAASDDDVRYKRLTDVSGGICYAPKLELPERAGVEMTLAQSTKYNYSKFKDFINTFESIDKNNNNIQTFAINEDYSDDVGRAACLVLKKVVKINEEAIVKELRKNILSALEQFETDPNSNKHNKECAAKLKKGLRHIGDKNDLNMILEALKNTNPQNNISVEIISLIDELCPGKK